MTNTDLFKKCLKEIERKLNWIDAKQWQQSHFESLSELIFAKTKVKLSPLTLKRLWGKAIYDSQPSSSTLDALARFLEYNDWIDYQATQKRNSIYPSFKFLRNKKVIVATSLVICILLLIIGFQKLVPLLNTKNYTDFEFSVEPLTSGLPNTVYFKYNVKNTDAESVVIQQSWDPKLHHQVDKNRTDFSCMYYYPGYYRAKMVLDGNEVAQQDLYVKSNGWLGIVRREPVPFYLPLDVIHDGDKLSIKEKHLIEAGFDLKKEIPQTTINLIDEFQNINGNNFELSTDFRQTYSQGEAICQKTELAILCSDGYFAIPFSVKGCVSELRIIIPNKYISAKNKDLRNLGVENSETIRLKLNVSEGILNLVVNNIPSIRDTLTVDPGKVVGVRFGFQGTGEVYSFNLKSEDNSYQMSDFFP